MPAFIEFSQATFRAGATEAERPRHEAALLGSLMYRPMIFRRNDVGWIATCAWRAAARVDDIAALKRAKRELDRRVIDGAAELVAALVQQLRGDRAADAITSVPVLTRAGRIASESGSRRASPSFSGCPSYRFLQTGFARACRTLKSSKSFHRFTGLPPRRPR